eukprot:2586017-Pyramimonas_sp.AAC.1
MQARGTTEPLMKSKCSVFKPLAVITPWIIMTQGLRGGLNYRGHAANLGGPGTPGISGSSADVFEPRRPY